MVVGPKHVATISNIIILLFLQHVSVIRPSSSDTVVLHLIDFVIETSSLNSMKINLLHLDLVQTTSTRVCVSRSLDLSADLIKNSYTKLHI
jgi:hypothetical protein